MERFVSNRRFIVEGLMQKEKTTDNDNTTQKHHVDGPGGEKHYMHFQCVRCGHCVSPGMFSTESWAVYKQTELCPDCQAAALSIPDE